MPSFLFAMLAKCSFTVSGCSLDIGDRRILRLSNSGHDSPANFCSFPERASLFHNNSPVTKILNENPAIVSGYFYISLSSVATS